MQAQLQQILDTVTATQKVASDTAARVAAVQADLQGKVDDGTLPAADVQSVLDGLGQINATLSGIDPAPAAATPAPADAASSAPPADATAQ